MVIELEQLNSELLTLSLESRAWLAQNLLASLDESNSEDVEALWLAEIQRRDAELKNGTVQCKPAEQVLQEAREQLRCPQ